MNIKGLRGALEKMMTCSNIFHKNDPLYDPALKVRLYNPAGKAKDFVSHHHAIVSDKGCPLPPKIHMTDWALRLGWVGLARSVHPQPEHMVTVQRLLRSDPLSGWMVPQPPNSAPGLSTWAAHSPQEVDGGGPT